jgi:hypothetical protein
MLIRLKPLKLDPVVGELGAAETTAKVATAKTICWNTKSNNVRET